MGYKVRILDLKTGRSLRSIEEIQDNVEVCWSDITKLESIEDTLDKIDIVVHMAAVLPPLALQQPDLARRVNVDGTKNLIAAIKQQQNSIPII